MFRLVFLLLAGIGLAMIFADSFPQPDKKPVKVTAVDESLTPLVPIPSEKIEPKIEKSVLVVDSPEPATVQKPLAEAPAPKLNNDVTELVAPSYLDLFQAPAIVGVDGTLQISTPATLANAESTIENASVEGPSNQPINVWFVTGERVNVRQGPTTSAAVVDQVVFAEAVEVLGEPENGWVMIRIEGDGLEGYMSNRFLQSNDPHG